MDKKSQLQKAQFKLTIIFTLLVFWIASLLQVSFFSYKYLSWIKEESKKIEFLSDTIANKNIPLHELNRIIKDERSLGERVEEQKLKWPVKGRIMNFAILDSHNNVLLQNIRWEINISAVMDVLQDKEEEIEINKGTIIKYMPIPRPIETYQLLLFKQLNYSFDNYLSDVFRFFLAIVTFSVLFFFIGYIFVKRNLKPVEDNITEMNNFVHNAWHELKTPIAVVNSNLQLMKQFWEYREDMIDENLTEINHLNKLIEALVTISDIKASDDINDNSIQDVLNHIVEEYKEIVKEKNITIKHIHEQDFIVSSDREYLYILLSNIIKNAIKFSEKWSAINISFMDNTCVIQDYGKWIKKKNLYKIFGRFFQESDTRNGAWFWIWLALVDKISQIYNWKIKVESVEWEGTKFIINF